jgi:ribosomal protein S16
VNHDRLAYWRGCGAQPSATVERLLKKLPAPEAVAPQAATK